MISAKDASDWSSTGGNFLRIHLRVLTVHYNINIKHTALPCLLRCTHTLTPRYLLKCVWYRQSAADTSLSLRATRSGCWMKCIALIIFNLRSCVGIFNGLWLLQHYKTHFSSSKLWSCRKWQFFVCFYKCSFFSNSVKIQIWLYRVTLPRFVKRIPRQFPLQNATDNLVR